MSDSPTWHIVKAESGHCQIVPSNSIDTAEVVEQWGPFLSQEEAIARRVGLIRAGKCQPN